MNRGGEADQEALWLQLDKLHDIAAGANPDTAYQPLPENLGKSLDLQRIGMFGHSLGGATTVQIMAHDDRVVAGIDLDGTVFPDIDPLWSPPETVNAAMAALASGIGNRPFMVMASGTHNPDTFFGPHRTSFWDNLYGWRQFVTIGHSGHFTYTDNELLFKQCIEAGIVQAPRNGATSSIRIEQSPCGALTSVRSSTVGCVDAIRIYWTVHLRCQLLGI